MGTKRVAGGPRSDKRERCRVAIDSSFLLDSPVVPDQHAPHSAKRGPTHPRERRRGAVDSAFLLDAMVVPDHDARHDTAAEPPRRSAKRSPPPIAAGSAATAHPPFGPRQAVHARPLKSLGLVRLPQNWEQQPPESGADTSDCWEPSSLPAATRGAASARGVSAKGLSRRVRSVRRKRHAVLWVMCALLLLAAVLLASLFFSPVKHSFVGQRALPQIEEWSTKRSP